MDTRLINIVPECYVDTNVVQTIMQKGGANHQKSCSMVLSTIKKSYKDKFAVGIIDRDKKNDSPFFKEYSEEIASDEELTLLKVPNEPHYLLLINNVMENFLLNCANEIHYDIKRKIQVPQTKEGLMSITKKRDSQESPVVSKLVKDLSNSKEMIKLKKSIDYLMKHPFGDNSNEIKNIFNK